MAGRLGRRPNNPAKPRLRLGRFLTDAVPPAPTKVDYLTGVDSWPMYGNDRLGDCTIAAAAHMIQAWTQFGQGDDVKVSDAEVLRVYSAVSGYDPKTGRGDDGAIMQDVLSYWRKHGIGGHRILAFAEIDLRNLDEVHAALSLFGHIYLGINVPASAMDQFDDGKPWDVVRNSPIEGGHAIDWGYYAKAENDQVVTWARAQQMTAAFRNKYAEEGWVVVDQEWINQNGTNPAGLDTEALNAAFEQITGQAGPFSDGPTPAPPTPVPDRGWLSELLTDLKAVVAKIESWLGG